MPSPGPGPPRARVEPVNVGHNHSERIPNQQLPALKAARHDVKGRADNDRNEPQRARPGDIVRHHGDRDHGELGSSGRNPGHTGARKLFIGQIPFTMEQPELTQVMAEFGKVVDTVILRNRMNGTHKGCAFVRFELEAEADLALESLHGKRKLGSVRTRHTAPPSL